MAAKMRAIKVNVKDAHTLASAILPLFSIIIKYTIQPNAPVRPQNMSCRFGAENNMAKDSVAKKQTINWIIMVRESLPE